MPELGRLSNLLNGEEENLAFLSPLDTAQLKYLYASVDNAIHMQQSSL